MRAALITLVLAVEVIASLPYKGLNEERLGRPEGRRVVAVIDAALQSVGRPSDPAAVRRGLIALSDALIAARAAALAPFSFRYDITATHQQWRLFLSPRPEFFGLRVEVQRGGHFEPLHVAYPRRFGEQSSRLRYRRLRGIYNPRLRKGPGHQYRGFVRWLANERMAADPSIEALRVSMQRLRARRGRALELLAVEHAITVEREGS